MPTMIPNKYRQILILILSQLCASADQWVQGANDSLLSETNDVPGHSGTAQVLSRRKRFIVFPDGSSFQLVFCAQNMGYIQIGDIVWFGNTAALAWELPTDPNIFQFFKNKEYFDAQRRGDITKSIYYLDEQGKLLSKVPYHKKFIVNPAFAKRSVDFVKTIDNQRDGNTIIDRITIKRMHKLHHKDNHLKCKDSECNAEFHREGRKGLYEKLETFIEALGWKGRQCVLRMLCEAGRDKSEQGTFLQEIVRAVFTLPGGQEFEAPQHQEYDAAHTAAGDCDQLFPECEQKFTEKSF